jgi:outer membrane lipoprotein-sorting protein
MGKNKMFKNEDDFKKIIARLDIDANPKDKHRENLRANMLSAFRETCKQNTRPASQWPVLWREIMRSSITKLAAAVVIIATVVFGIHLLDKSATPAWAIEDTIKALENIYAVKMSGSVSQINENGEKAKGDFVLWAKPREDGTGSKEVRFEVPGQIIVVDASEKTYFYYPKQNSVSIKEFENFHIQPWIDSRFFHIIKKFTENWRVSYGKDEETGKESIFVTCQYSDEPKSWWFEFDSETKLPVRFKQWTNINFQGEPEFYAAKIEYNPDLPEGIFEFKIPEGAKVTQIPHKLPNYLNDPNCGLSVEGLTDEEACLKIIRDYWQAIIDGDWEYLAQLRPICNAEKWELKYKQNESWPIEILEIGQPSQEKGCNIGPIVSCMIKYSDGQIKNIKLIVKIRNIEGNKSCVIAGTYGGIKDFER